MSRQYYIIYQYDSLRLKRIILEISEPIDSAKGIELAMSMIADKEGIPDEENIVIQNWYLLRS